MEKGITNKPLNVGVGYDPFGTYARLWSESFFPKYGKRVISIWCVLGAGSQYVMSANFVDLNIIKCVLPQNCLLIPKARGIKKELMTTSSCIE